MNKALFSLLLSLAFIQMNAQTLTKRIVKFDGKSDWLIKVDTPINRSNLLIYNPICDCRVYAKQSDILSLTGGIVQAIIKVGVSYWVCIKYGGYYITYCDIGKPNLTKKQSIAQGSAIGPAIYMKQKKRYEFSVRVQTESYILCEKELFAFLSDL